MTTYHAWFWRAVQYFMQQVAYHDCHQILIRSHIKYKKLKQYKCSILPSKDINLQSGTVHICKFQHSRNLTKEDYSKFEASLINIPRLYPLPLSNKSPFFHLSSFVRVWYLSIVSSVAPFVYHVSCME